VVSSQHSPSHWVPMDLSQVECKLMEVRKYSADYHEIDKEFRKPNLELINCYTVQNPFLYGTFSLRKEQMRMQVEGKASVKDKLLFYPTTFDNLDDLVRNGFLPGVAAAAGSFRTPAAATDILQCSESALAQTVPFFADSHAANLVAKATRASGESCSNPRVMIVARVSMAVCQLLPYPMTSPQVEIAGRTPSVGAIEQQQLHSVRNSRGLRVDTFANDAKTVFFKAAKAAAAGEVYPETIIVYRDKEGPPDGRTSRINDVIKQGVLLSYRSGTRYNPEEAKFAKAEAGTNQSSRTSSSAAAAAKEGDSSKKKKNKKSLVDGIKRSKKKKAAEDQGSKAADRENENPNKITESPETKTSSSSHQQMETGECIQLQPIRDENEKTGGNQKVALPSVRHEKETGKREDVIVIVHEEKAGSDEVRKKSCEELGAKPKQPIPPV